MKIIWLCSLLCERSRKFIQKELNEAGLSNVKPAYGDVFNVLFANKTCNLQTLVDLTGRPKSTISELVDKLMKADFVYKTADQSDGRGVTIGLTAKGEKLQLDFERISKELSMKILSASSPEEIKKIEKSLEAIVKAFK